VGKKGTLKASYTGIYCGIRGSEKEEGSSYELVRENIKAVDPALNGIQQGCFSMVFFGTKMPYSGDHSR